MAQGIVLGLNANTSENTGTTDVPVYVTITNIRDETLNMDTALSDVTTRAANGWRLQVGTLSEATVDAQMVYLAGVVPEFDNIRNAFLDKSRLLMGFFDDDPIASPAVINGLVGGFGVTNFSIGRQLEEAMIVDVTFTVRENDNDEGPEWVTITNP